MSDKTGLGDRMKSNYEDRTRIHLPRRTNTIIRIDGKAFHTYTKGFTKPFDDALSASMDMAAGKLCSEAMGCKCAYGQSDEYSFVLTDYDTLQTEAWLDGNVQKIVSVAASIFTTAFNISIDSHKTANFDARVFTIPEITEVQNYLIWRQQDCTRNAIQSLGQAHFSHKQLQGMKCSEIQDRLFTEKGINFNDEATRFKRGRVIWRETYLNAYETPEERSCWSVDREPPVFTQQRDYFGKMRVAEPTAEVVS